MIDSLFLKLANIAETEFADVTTCCEIKEGKLRLFIVGDFLLFSGLSGKTPSTQRDEEKNNNPLQSSASSAVNLFCQYPLIQNKFKSL